MESKTVFLRTMGAILAVASSAALSCVGIGDEQGSASQAVLTPPADDQFVAFECGDAPADDGKGGTGGKDVDIVGDATYPAIFRALDATYLYVRIRLDGTPADTDGLTPKNWGVLIDSDGDPTSFEYLLNVDGNASTITWEFNDVQDPPDDPGDGVRTVLQTYTPWEDFYHVKATGDGSNFSMDADYFLTVAIRRSDLAAAGISLYEPISIWAATSTNNINFSADLSCVDGGNPGLDGNETDLDPLDPACLIDSDGDGQCDPIDVCPLDDPDDTDNDGVCDSDDPCPDDNPDDTDGDGVCDSDDPCPLDNPNDTDGDGVCDSDDQCPFDADDADSDQDGACNGTDNCPDIPNPTQRDDDGDGLGNACDDCPADADNDADGDTVCADLDNCPNDPNFDQRDSDADGLGDVCDSDADGDGIDDIYGVSGGGCSAGGTGNADLVLLLALLAMLAWMAPRRRRLVAGLAALLVASQGGVASAQLATEKTFPVERFRLTTTDNGILNVEWGQVPKHLAWSLSAWVGNADDTLVVYDGADPDRRRLGSLVDTRVGGAINGSVSLVDRVAIGLTIPVVLYQNGDEINGVQMPSELSSGGLGDIELDAKLALLAPSSPLGLALRAAFSVPSASGDNDYLGEESVAFTSEAIASYRHGRIRGAVNAGLRLREDVDFANLGVGDELFFRVGLGVALTSELEAVATLTAATSLSDPYMAENQGVTDLLGGLTYDVPGPLAVFAAGGGALDEGFGGPDWRALIGARFAQERANDTDGDGLTDDRDGCPLVPEDLDGFEDTDGCPDDDNDQDQVPDASDGAPMDPEDRDGFQDEDGIPDPDNDGDGIADENDRCPLEAETINQFEDDDGCPDVADPDNDGIVGADDRCPQEPEDKDGFEDDDGCPDDDNDKDSLADANDSCPMEAGPVENRGCPDLDRDGDTVVDRLDNCPDEKGSVKNHGCKRRQLVKITPTKLVIVGTVLFPTGKATVRRGSYKLLNNVASVLKAHPEIARVVVEGHTDDRGKDEFNLTLSQKRADAVMAYLVKQGVDAGRLAAKGFGETQPVESNKTARGRRANRRVEFTIEGAAGGASSAGKANPAFPDPGFGETKLGDRKSIDDKGPATDDSTIKAVLAKYRQSRRAVDRCYRRARESDPSLKIGKAQLLIRVDTDGKTSAKTSGLSDVSMLICLQSMVRRWTFPKPKSAVEVAITLVFKE